RHGCYTREPAQPFRSASIDHIQCGEIECDRTSAEVPGANLGLYSVTFVNDNIIRTLAGVPESGRPVFLKIVYHGPRAMEELAQYDPNLVVGILGGSAGTTYDAFKLIHDAQKYGARVALYGRKINNAEHQLAFIEMLRLITDGKVTPEEAVRAYHGVLQSKGIKPHRSLNEDLKLTDQAMSYEGNGSRSTVSIRNNPLATSKPAEINRTTNWPILTNGTPNFDQMN